MSKATAVYHVQGRRKPVRKHAGTMQAALNKAPRGTTRIVIERKHTVRAKGRSTKNMVPTAHLERVNVGDPRAACFRDDRSKKVVCKTGGGRRPIVVSPRVRMHSTKAQHLSAEDVDYRFLPRGIPHREHQASYGLTAPSVRAGRATKARKARANPHKAKRRGHKRLYGAAAAAHSRKVAGKRRKAAKRH